MTEKAKMTSTSHISLDLSAYGCSPFPKAGIETNKIGEKEDMIKITSLPHRPGGAYQESQSLISAGRAGQDVVSVNSTFQSHHPYFASEAVA